MVFTKEKEDLVQKVLVAILFAALFLSFTVPSNDPDFWWHLASGKWMWHNGTLISGDPYTIDSPFKVFSRTFDYRQYWLSQLTFYATYLGFGYNGIIILGAAVFTAMFYMVYALTRRAGAGRTLGLVLMYAAFMVIVKEFDYIGIRPQMWSSLFAIAIVYLLEALRRNERWSCFAIPVLMLVWANLHGGWVIGDAILVVYLSGALISRTLSRPQLVVILAAILVSGVNPEGFMTCYRAATYLLGPVLAKFGIIGFAQIKELEDSISETQSIFSHASIMGIVRQLPLFSGIMLFSIGSFLLNIRKARRIHPELVLLYLFLLVLVYSSIRYIIFFATLAPLLVAVNLRIFREGRQTPRRFLPQQAAAIFTIMLALAMGYRFAQAGISTTVLGSGKRFSSEYEQAADFVVNNGLRGNMFNDYNPGGYLIWRLSPDVKFFIDGRNLYGDMFSLYRAIVDNPLEVEPGYDNRPHYAFALDYFNIDMLMIPGCDRVSGTLIKLAPALLDDPAWALVFADRDVMIFLRNSPKNRDVIKANAVPRAGANWNIYALATEASRSRHAAIMPNWKLSKAFALAGDDQIPEALRLLGEYRQKVPDDTFAMELQAKLLNRPR